jgi:hypothetical protein
MRSAPFISNLIRRILFIIVSAALVLIIGILLNACGSAASLPPARISSDISTVIPTEPKLTPSPVFVSPEPTQDEGLTPEQVRLGWGNPANLDSKHKDVPCKDCHTIENQYDPPPDTACLNCHGGSYAAITDLTRGYKPINPHDYHYSTSVTCSFCHGMHEPQDSPCGFCHEEKQLTKPSIIPTEAHIDPNNSN